MGKSKTEYTYLQDYTKERKGDYLGATIQVIPHVTNEIKLFINSDLNDEDIIQAEGLIYQTLNCDNRVKDIE